MQAKELEKIKFVLDYKYKELKKEIEPKETHAHEADMKSLGPKPTFHSMQIKMEFLPWPISCWSVLT